MEHMVIPQLDVSLNQNHSLGFALGISLVILAYLMFSIWREQLLALQEEERLSFLMFDLKGGSWLLAVFSFCGGVYILASCIGSMRI